MTTKICHEWQAEAYHVNSEIQKIAATNLIQLLSLRGNEKILDVGCGDGKITKILSQLTRDGSVIGIDASSRMIEFASQQYGKDNLEFILQKAEEIEYRESFDVIFSSFSLQWVVNIDSFFEKAFDGLKPDGLFACTIPLSISRELEQSLDLLMQDSTWSPYFKNFILPCNLRSANEYADLLSKAEFRKTHFEVVEQKWIFSSRRNLENYVITWLPHINVIPEGLKKTFFQELVNEYLRRKPATHSGEVHFIFERIDFIGKKG